MLAELHDTIPTQGRSVKYANEYEIDRDLYYFSKRFLND